MNMGIHIHIFKKIQKGDWEATVFPFSSMCSIKYVYMCVKLGGGVILVLYLIPWQQELSINPRAVIQLASLSSLL